MRNDTYTTSRASGRGPAATATATGCLLAAGLALAGCSSSASSPSSASSAATSSATGSATSAPATASPVASTASPSSSGGSAASVPFPVGVGNTWKYATTAVGETGTTVDKMTAVVPVAIGQRVTMSDTSTLVGVTTTNASSYIFGNDGSITYPLNQVSSTAAGVSVSGSGAVWPPAAQIDSGKPSTSELHMTIKEAGQTLSVVAHITVQGAGTQTVTVPAGTYNATVVNMTISFTVEGISVSEEIKTWLASGVGPVKDEVLLDEAGTNHVTASEELESFTKG